MMLSHETKLFKVLIWVNADNKNGMGNLSRSIVLANIFRNNDFNVKFLTNSDISKKILAEEKFESKILNISEKELYFKEIVKKIEIYKPDIIIVDVFDVKKKYMKILKSLTKILVTFDYKNEGLKYADIIINSLYKNKIIDVNDKKLYQGLKYIMINEKFKKISKKIINNTVKNILITQGGADTSGFTPEIMKALENIESNLNITVVVGPYFKQKEKLNSFLKTAKRNYKILYDVNNMEKIINDSDIVITGGGITLFEALYLGKPCIAICNEKHEEETTKILENKKAILNLGFNSELQKEKLNDNINELLNNLKLRLNLSKEAKMVIDNKGAERIYNIIINELYEIK